MICSVVYTLILIQTKRRVEIILVAQGGIVPLILNSRKYKKFFREKKVPIFFLFWKGSVQLCISGQLVQVNRFHKEFKEKSVGVTCMVLKIFVFRYFQPGIFCDLDFNLNGFWVHFTKNWFSFGAIHDFVWTSLLP